MRMVLLNTCRTKRGGMYFSGAKHSGVSTALAEGMTSWAKPYIVCEFSVTWNLLASIDILNLSDEGHRYSPSASSTLILKLTQYYGQDNRPRNALDSAKTSTPS